MVNTLVDRKAHVQYFEQPRNPLPGDILFDALQPPSSIILAANTRLTLEAVQGIFQAAKDTENIVILELALSEMNLTGGYTGLTPATFAARVRKAAETVGWYGYVLHADHITVSKGTDKEIEDVKKEIDARINAGFSSFAVDSSFLFDRSKTKVEDQLKDVTRTSIMLFKYIKEKMGDKHYGREGEVGEIGIKEYTEVEEALHYLATLKQSGVEINCLAIANGTRHGVVVDEKGKIIPKMGINIPRTIEIADAIKAKGYKTGLAQHGITSTPIDLIASKFPKGKIIKGNVGTQWMLLVWDILQIFEPELYGKIYDWTINKYKKEGVPEPETFASEGKRAIKTFFNELENISEDAKRAIRARAYSEALVFFRAFGMKQTAKKAYDHISQNKIKY
jgi:fructose-bisphosphate aldolase class II